MADPTPQHYGNHVYQPRAWAVVWLIALVGVLLAAWGVWNAPTTVAAWTSLAVAAGALGTISLLRVFALRLQTRIIRMEMDARLRRLGLERELAQLLMPQLVALRFASDQELPALAQRALSEQLTSDQIKRAVTSWQADRMRT